MKTLLAFGIVLMVLVSAAAAMDLEIPENKYRNEMQNNANFAKVTTPQNPEKCTNPCINLEKITIPRRTNPFPNCKW
jgi:hypothetical protein